MKRLIVKVGTSTLTDADGRLDRAYIEKLCHQVLQVRQLGWQVVVVSSGAIRAGVDRLALKRRPQLIPEKQAAAAVGQGLLHQVYTQALDALGIASAQVLLTRDDFADRIRYLNARNTLLTLLRLGAVPVVNENDTVSVEEIRFGDNDMLAALVASHLDADLVILLTDVPGLCRHRPRAGEAPDVVPEVQEITPEIEKMARGGDSARGGTGGMASKIAAARVAIAAGIPMIIAQGREDGIVIRAARGEAVGTRFHPQNSRLNSRKRWMAFAVPARGSIRVNRNAADVLLSQNKSLLPVGVIDVSGDFAPGDLVLVVDESGDGVARGFVNYNSEEVRRIMGKRSSEIERTLGHKEFDEVIHRDNLVVGV
ncbi:MAG: glutamate 5-kinase [Armatimonadetes bacterium]|nr:glutamate 5-kinase [Armatimonadota bacterium]